MPAWGTKEGGLRPEEIDQVVAFLRAQQPSAPSASDGSAAPVEESLGRETFARLCAPCHGERGQGSAVAPPLAAADNPATHDDSRLYGTITVGVQGTAMGAFRELDARTLHSLIAFVRALAPVEEKRAGWSAKPGDAKKGGESFARNCARCHGDGFGSEIAENHEDHRHPHSSPTVREKAAVRGEVRERDCRPRRESGEQREPKDDEEDDGDDFNHREPIFKEAEVADATGLKDAIDKMNARHSKTKR